jgi:dTDP-4-dehydrorhamnose reductase
MRYLITGHHGQLATDFKAVLAPRAELVLTDLEDLRLEDQAGVRALVDEARPDVILNCAAYNRVDQAEAEPAEALAANALAPRNLALAARECGATLVHFSTDYVFDGPGRRPYVETDAPAPGCVYGVSKLAGEHMVLGTTERSFVFRVCGLYGYAGSRDKGSNFVETMIGLARQGKPLRVVNDQTLTPTATRDVVDAVLGAIEYGRYGLYHLTATGACTWYKFARAIFDELRMDVSLSPAATAEYPTSARRPAYSVLDNAAYRGLGFADLAPWRESLSRYLAGRAGHGRV